MKLFREYSSVLAGIAAVGLAAWLYIYVPHIVGSLAFFVILAFAVGLSLFVLVGRKPEMKAKLVKVWKAVLDFFWGI